MDIKKQSLMKAATYASVFTAIIIIIVKLYAWIATDSLSLMASLVDSALDIAASAINLVAVRYALKPADEDHRFGHGKAEDIAAFAQSAFIAGSAAFIAIEAIGRFINPRSIAHTDIGIAAMIFSIVMTLALVSFQLYAVKKTRSSVVQADALHYQTDLLVNAAVIGSLLLTRYIEMPFIDPLLGIFIAAYIMRSAWKVGRKAFDNLMDKELPDALREEIMTSAIACDKVKGVHDLRSRYSGLKAIVQIHVELDGTLLLQDAHDVAENVEEAIMKILPDAEVLVHLDPATSRTIDINKNHVMSLTS